MSAEYSVEEVRDAARQLVGPMGRMLHNYANLLERIEADERSVPVAWCSLTPNGQIAYFDGKPMIMPGNVGNEHHPDPLFTHPPAQAPIIVPPYVSADDANRLYGEAFGVDWKYETAPAQAEPVMKRPDDISVEGLRAKYTAIVTNRDHWHAEVLRLRVALYDTTHPHSPDAAK